VGFRQRCIAAIDDNDRSGRRSRSVASEIENRLCNFLGLNEALDGRGTFEEPASGSRIWSGIDVSIEEWVAVGLGHTAFTVISSIRGRPRKGRSTG